MNNEQCPNSCELSALISRVGGISLNSSSPDLNSSEQWIALPSRDAGFVCSADAPQDAIDSLKSFLVRLHNVNKVLDASQQNISNQEELERLVMLDPLTELPNRRKLFEALHEIQKSKRQSAILQIDLDRFKQINDSLGHAAGDEVLIVVANRLSANVRPGDLVSRIGGDEFVVACPDISGEQSMVELADRLIESLNQPMQLQGHQYQVGVSIGIAIKNPEQQLDADTWLQNADLALYTSKNKGRNQFHLYQTQMRTSFDNAQSMKHELSAACENGSIIAHFQPTICLQSGLISGIQAMARWQHSRLGLLSFSEFSKHADESILRLIDKEMFSQCLQGIRTLSASDIDVSKFSISVPMSRLREYDSVQYLVSETEQQGLSADQVSLEVIEDGQPITSDDAMLDNVASLRNAGYGICLNNLGGSQGNLQSILLLKPHSLKLDSSLCKELSNDPLKQAIVSSLIQMAEKINASIIATAVETIENRDILSQLGCNLIQGHCIYPPADIETLSAWLDSPEAQTLKAA